MISPKTFPGMEAGIPPHLSDSTCRAEAYGRPKMTRCSQGSNTPWLIAVADDDGEKEEEDDCDGCSILQWPRHRGGVTDIR